MAEYYIVHSTYNFIIYLFIYYCYYYCTYVINPQTWYSVDESMCGRDKVSGHDESEALTERRPVVVAP